MRGSARGTKSMSKSAAGISPPLFASALSCRPMLSAHGPSVDLQTTGASTPGIDSPEVPRHFRGGQLVASMVGALPALFVLSAILQAAPLPDLDYWYALEKITDEDGFSTTLRSWFVRSNEHLITIGAIIYFINYHLTGGSSVGLSCFAWLMGVIQVLTLIRLLPEQIKAHRLLYPCAAFLVSSAIFTIAAQHNWLRGMSGACWVTANACTVLAFSRFLSNLNRGATKVPWGAMAWATLGSLTYSTGLMAWPLLLLASIAHSRRSIRPFLALIVATVAFGATSIAISHISRRHLRPGATTIWNQIEFLLNFIGMFEWPSRPAATFLGLGGLAAGCVLAWWAVRSKNLDVALPWIMLMGVSFLSALLGARYRAPRGFHTAFASRYATLPALFWLGLGLLILIFVARRLPRSTYPLPWAGAGAFVVGSLSIVPYFSHWTRFESEISRQDLKRVAALSMRLGVHDEEIVGQVAARRLSSMLPLVPVLQKLRHVPYNDRSTACPALGTPFTAIREPFAPAAKPVGAISKVETVRSVGLRVSGVVGLRETSEAHCLTLLDQRGIVQGEALVGPQIPTTRVATPGLRRYRWLGYVRATPEGLSEITPVLLKETTEGSLRWITLTAPHGVTEYSGARLPSNSETERLPR